MSESILDFKITNSIDPDELVRQAIKWHFSEETGTPFWLKIAKNLRFDPLTDIKCYDDLQFFPNVAAELRIAPIEDLIPRGYGKHPKLTGIFESGGTTGAPKRVVCMQDWFQHLVNWSNSNLELHGFPRHGNWLGLTPTGPHFVGRLFTESATTYGKQGFTVDIDPRWVKKLMAAGKTDEVDVYAEHIIDQASFILKTQNIEVITITPPLLERLAQRSELVNLVNQKVRAIRWGGTQMSQESRYLYRKEIFPSIILYGHYGNTMILGIAGERAGLGDHEPCIFDSFSPYITFSVIDVKKNQPVAYGERGRIVTHHVSKALFLPNNLERDIATRIKPKANQVGDSVANIAPVQVFENEEVFEGVY